MKKYLIITLLLLILGVLLLKSPLFSFSKAWFSGNRHANFTETAQDEAFDVGDGYTWENSQWRGENRDGTYHETGLLAKWPDKGPEMLWSFEGLGDGFTSAAIANGRIYITGLTGKKLILYVLNLKGQLIKRREVGNERSMLYPGTRSTVCVNEGKLYIYNALGNLYCLDEASLNPVWTKDLFGDFDGQNITWGVTESPLIVGEKIFMTPGGVKNNMVALNKNTGELIWSSPGLGTTSSYCSPQYIGDMDIPIIVTNTLQDLVAFDANTGEALWSFPQTNKQNIHPNTPLYSDGMILSTTGYKGGTVMLKLIDGGRGIEQVWKNEEMDCQIGGVVRVGDYVYATSHENGKAWLCLDRNTGQIMHKERSLGGSNVISADGMLYCYSDRGMMYLVKPNPDKPEIVSSFKVTLGTNQHWAHPVIHEGVLYVRHGDALMAYKIK